MKAYKISKIHKMNELRIEHVPLFLAQLYNSYNLRVFKTQIITKTPISKD